MTAIYTIIGIVGLAWAIAITVAVMVLAWDRILPPEPERGWWED